MENKRKCFKQAKNGEMQTKQMKGTTVLKCCPGKSDNAKMDNIKFF